MNRLRIFNLLFILGLSGMCYAMEGEKKETPKEQELFELFAELPLEIQQKIIISAAKIGTLQEAVENIKNLALVNKEFNEFINSPVGTKLILDGLMDNENFQKFFNQLVVLSNKLKFFWLGDPKKGPNPNQILINTFMQDQSNIKELLAAVLRTPKALERFKIWKESDKERNYIVDILGGYLKSIAQETTDMPLQKSINYMANQIELARKIIRKKSVTVSSRRARHR